MTLQKFSYERNDKVYSYKGDQSKEDIASESCRH